MSLNALARLTGLPYLTLRNVAHREKKIARKIDWLSECPARLTQENFRLLGAPANRIEGILTAPSESDETSREDR